MMNRDALYNMQNDHHVDFDPLRYGRVAPHHTIRDMPRVYAPQHHEIVPKLQNLQADSLDLQSLKISPWSILTHDFVNPQPAYLDLQNLNLSPWGILTHDFVNPRPVYLN